MPVHLAQRAHLDAGLAHVEDEVRQPLVFGDVEVGPCKKQSPVCVVRAGGPDLLTIDHPTAVLELSPGHRAGKVGAAARLAEQLAPGVFASQYAAQERTLLKFAA